MPTIDQFYKLSPEMLNDCNEWQTKVTGELKTYLEKAKQGDRDAESKAINLIGTIKRSTNFVDLTHSLVGIIRLAVEYFKSTGRTVDFSATDPRMWISGRSGGPRWKL